MSISSLSDLSRQHMLNMLGAGAPKQNSQLAGGAVGTSQMSPFAQILSGLQQLQQTNSAQYSKVSQQVSSNLSAAATQAQGQGNTSLATQLNILSQDFATASQTGNMPNFQDLETAMHATGGAVKATASSTLAAATNAAHFSPLKMMGQALGLVGI